MYNQKDLLLEIMTMAFTDLDILEYMIGTFTDGNSADDFFKPESKTYDDKFKSIAQIIQSKHQIYALDEVMMIIDKFYRQEHLRDERKSEEILYSHLKKIARFFLSHREGRICMKYWKSDDDDIKNIFLGPYEGLPKITLWHSLSRMISTDILVCIYFSEKNKFRKLEKEEKQRYTESVFNEIYRIERGTLDYSKADIEVLKGYYNQIQLEDLQLTTILEKGLSETHLHASAGKHFYQTWSALMNGNPSDETMDSLEKWLKQRPLISKNMDYKKLILEANLIRNILILKIYANYNMNELFNKLNIWFQEDVANYDSFIDQISKDKLEPFYMFFKSNQRDKFSEKEIMTLSNWLYKRLMSNVQCDDFREFEKIGEDPLVRRYLDNSRIVKGVDTIGENIFLFRCFKHIDELDINIRDSSEKNKIILDRKEMLFMVFRYIGIKNMVYQEHAQQNQIKGLQNFLSYFNSSTKTGRPENRELFWEQILNNQFQDPNIKKIELRMSLEEDGAIKEIQAKFLEELECILKVYLKLNKKNFKSRELPLIGIIIHFIKKSDRKHDKCWMAFERNSGKLDDLLDHENSRTIYVKQIIALKDLLYRYSELSKFVVGIDAASDENAAEPWVFAPIYDYARDGKDGLLNFENETMNHFGFTFHVGEDFRHILTGLRRIDEVIEHFKYHSGDRIGHGIALGTNLEKWKKTHPVVILPRIEYLENLLWVWGIYKEYKLVSGIDGFLERRIMQIANKIYTTMEGITVFELWKAYRGKFKEIKIDNEFKDSKNIEQCNRILSGQQNGGFPNRIFCCETNERDAYVWNSKKLGLTYHCKVYRERMLEPISISSDELNLEILKDIQSLIRKKISREGIIVETNPTSNRAIGEIEDIFEHYIIDLKSKQFMNSNENGNVENNLIVTLNTDDPSVFQTSLSSEFAYIYYALLDRGYAKKDVLEWMEEVRRNGMSSSFIKDRDNMTYLKEIKILLRQITKERDGREDIDYG